VIPSGMKRVATAILGGAGMVLSLWLGPLWFWIVVMAVALIAQYELLHMLRLRDMPVDYVVAIVAGFFVMLHVVWAYWYAGLGVVFLFYILQLQSRGSEKRPMERLAGFTLSLLWPVAGLSFLAGMYVQLHAASGRQVAFPLMLVLLLLVWASDSGAYYAGRALGRHKLAPAVSPGKTWEGAAGGLVAALGIAWAAVSYGPLEIPMYHALALALIAATVGPVGDLLESLFKRSARIKDSGTWLPGHGGFLDRFDALILVAPAYWIYWNVMNIMP